MWIRSSGHNPTQRVRPVAELAYAGNELEIFAHAQRWKAYIHSEIRAFIHGDVAEVGAGLGAVTQLFLNESFDNWTCIEPDPSLMLQLKAALAPSIRSGHVHCVDGSLQDVAAEPRFDVVLYIDVLEHIELDREELEHSAQRLKAGGTLIVLCPAHGFLYSPFDRAIGHHRRYDKRSLAAVAPSALTCLRLRYLDSVGMLASLANRLWLKQQNPTHAQVALWDRWMVPMSRRIDPWLRFALGKSVLGVWQKR
jgi:2-polyprenyl-3-methyl-5-hydroxy-6-metoxy-1,4-benzoquinol methylase